MLKSNLLKSLPTRRRRLLLGAAAIALFALASPASAQTPRDTVVMTKQIDDIVSLDPAESFEFSGNEVVANIYDRLILPDPQDASKMIGQIAESWSLGADGRTYSFKLKPNQKFHSGNAVTAEDVVYSIHRAVALNKTPGFILTQFGLSKDTMAQAVRASDAQTVMITTDKAYAPSFFYACMTAAIGSVVDAKLVKQNEKDGDWGNAWLKQNSAGSGAYRLRAWRANESVTLEANDNWALGKVKNRRVVIQHVAEPQSQRLLVEKGDADYARDLVKDQIEALRSNPNIKVQEGNKGYILYLGLNTKNPNFAKPEVREAMKWLVDYDSIERNIVRGAYVPHQTFLPRGFLGAISDRPYKLDVAKAKALLTKAGLADGFTVTMDTRNVSPITDIAQAIQATLAQAGIKLEILPGDGRQTLTKYRARQHDIYIGQWGPDYADPHTNAQTFAMNEDNKDDAKSKTLAWRNSWDVPEMTKKTLGLVFEQDTAKRAKGYEEVQREHLAISPFVIMFQQIAVAPHRANVDGFIIGGSSDTTFYWNIAKN
jgi:peptide/nickel transport system substrate-binding protein